VAQGIQKRVGKRGVSYRVRVDYPPDPLTGKRVRRSETVHNYDDAKSLYKRWSEEAQNVLAPSNRKLTLAEWSREWLASRAVRQLSTGTQRRYADLFGLYLLPALGPYRLDRLTPKKIDEMYIDLLETPRKRTGKPLASKTANLTHNMLKACLKAAVRANLIVKNPVDEVTAPARPKPVVRCWKAAEAVAWLVLADQDQYHTMWRLFAHTGMRRGEVLGLKWDGVDLDRAALRVEGSRSRAERGKWADGET
jgi:integrase